MLTIRFSRIGKRKKPFFRIIISEKHKDTHGHYLELLGHYNPHTKDAVFKKDRILYWIQKGATLSNSVFNLLVAHKVIESAAKRKSVYISGKRKTKKAAAAKGTQEQPESKASASDAPQEKELTDNK